MGKLSLAEKLNLPSTNKGHIIDAAEKRITELEAHLRNCLVLLSDTPQEERCGALRAAMEFYNHGRHEDRVEFTTEAALIEMAREARELKLD